MALHVDLLMRRCAASGCTQLLPRLRSRHLPKPRPFRLGGTSSEPRTHPFVVDLVVLQLHLLVRFPQAGVLGFELRGGMPPTPRQRSIGNAPHQIRICPTRVWTDWREVQVLCSRREPREEKKPHWSTGESLARERRERTSSKLVRSCSLSRRRCFKCCATSCNSCVTRLAPCSKERGGWRPAWVHVRG